MPTTKAVLCRRVIGIRANGVDGDLAMLAPPFIVTEAEIDEIVNRFGAALEIVT